MFLITARLCELQGPAGFRRSWTEGAVAGLNFVSLILRGVFSVAAGVVFGRQDAGEGTNGLRGFTWFLMCRLYLWPFDCNER